MTTIDLATRRKLVQLEGVTLNGQPAVIMGARNDYATVAQLPDGAKADWAWETVLAVVTKRAKAFRL